MAWPPSWLAVPGGAASNRCRLLPRCLQLSHITLDLLDVDNCSILAGGRSAPFIFNSFCDI